MLKQKIINFIQGHRARTSLFIARASLIDMTVPRVLLWELPRVVVWRAYNRAAAIIYDLIDRRRWADKSIKKSLHQLTENEGIYFYIIAVPQVLHLLIPAVQLVQHQAKIIFILNGISAAEERSLHNKFPDIPTLRVWTLIKSSWPHGHLLSLLLRNSRRDFGILDHDFFLFDPSAFEQLTFQENEFAICATTWRNKLTGEVFPGTHLLYLRVAPLQELMTQYDIGAQLYKRIPENAKALLKEMNLSLNNPPKEYQSFFDSFLMLSALAIHYGLTIRPLNIAEKDLAHIGGTSMGLASTKDAVHHYVSSRFMEHISDPAINKEYHRYILTDPDKIKRLRNNIDPVTANEVDTLIERVISTI